MAILLLEGVTSVGSGEATPFIFPLVPPVLEMQGSKMQS